MLYVALHSGFEHTLLFKILVMISSLGVVKFITKSTFLLFSARISSSFSACSTVRGKPSNIAPSLQSSSLSLFITIGTVISSGTSCPFDIYSFAFFPNSVLFDILALKISPVEICGQPVSFANIPATVPFPVP